MSGAKLPTIPSSAMAKQNQGKHKNDGEAISVNSKLHMRKHSMHDMV